MSSQPCHVCGSTNFSTQSGYYICDNCDTQSQEIQEQTFEYAAENPVVENEERIEEVFLKEEHDRKLTSWECYNLILRGLVDELVNLGARPVLKSVAFQLWASYLRAEGIAFFSKDKEKLPILPTSFKNRDLEILYGIKNFRRMYFKDLIHVKNKSKKTSQSPDEMIDTDSDDSVSSKCSLKSLRTKQRKVAVSALPDDSDPEGRNSSGSDLETLNDIDKKDHNSDKQVKISFNKSARKSMEDLVDRYDKVKREHGNDIPTNVRNWFSNHLYKTRKSDRNSKMPPLTINMILTILHTSLLLIEDEIQLSDLLRWSYEGRLSTYQPTKFVPDTDGITHTEIHPSSRSNLLLDMRNFTEMLKLNTIPTPDLYKLVERFAYELCLPAELTKFVQRLVAIFPPHMDYAFYQYRVFPDYESRAMAFILYAFKLLCSLDDATEICQSEFAETVNELNEGLEIKLPVLFSWCSWVKYLECRKAVLCEYDVCINQLVNRDDKIDENVMLNYWEKMKPRICNTPSRMKINPTLKLKIEETIKGMQRKCHIKSYKNDVIFPSTTTPFRTYTEYLLTELAERFSETTRQILSTNINSHSIEYLIDHEWAITVGKNFELDVEPIFDVANDETKLYKEPESNIPTVSKSKTVPAHVPLLVEIVDDASVEEEGESYEPQVKTMYSESEKKNKREPKFKLYFPSSNYWFFHPNGRRLNSEKFNEIAEENFSHSFLWLLKECALLLRTEMKDLYVELMCVEIALCSIFSNDSYFQQAPIIVYPNEW